MTAVKLEDRYTTSIWKMILMGINLMVDMKNVKPANSLNF